MGGPGSGRKKGSGGGNKTSPKPVSFSLNMAKMKANPMPKALKKKFAKSGGVNSKSYQTWVRKNWT